MSFPLKEGLRPNLDYVEMSFPLKEGLRLHLVLLLELCVLCVEMSFPLKEGLRLGRRGASYFIAYCRNVFSIKRRIATPPEALS